MIQFFGRLFSALLGNYVVLEHVGYGLYQQERSRHFLKREDAEAFAQASAEQGSGRVVVLRKNDRSVISVFKDGELLERTEKRRRSVSSRTEASPA